jgi:Lar family restriction alleviation protein
MTNNELKPCPFCGEVPEWFSDNSYPFIIACIGDCDIRPEYKSFLKEDAIAAWNKRMEGK